MLMHQDEQKRTIHTFFMYK